MATIRQRSPGVWEVRVYAGRDDKGRPAQVSRIVRGSRRTAERAAANLTVAEPSAGGGHTVGALLDMWQEPNRDGWTPATAASSDPEPAGEMSKARTGGRREALGVGRTLDQVSDLVGECKRVATSFGPSKPTDNHGPDIPERNPRAGDTTAPG